MSECQSVRMSECQNVTECHKLFTLIEILYKDKRDCTFFMEIYARSRSKTGQGTYQKSPIEVNITESSALSVSYQLPRDRLKNPHPQ